MDVSLCIILVEFECNKTDLQKSLLTEVDIIIIIKKHYRAVKNILAGGGIYLLVYCMWYVQRQIFSSRDCIIFV